MLCYVYGGTATENWVGSSQLIEADHFDLFRITRDLIFVWVSIFKVMHKIINKKWYYLE
jgi:hypothetical protein